MSPRAQGYVRQRVGNQNWENFLQQKQKQTELMSVADLLPISSTSFFALVRASSPSLIIPIYIIEPVIVLSPGKLRHA